MLVTHQLKQGTTGHAVARFVVAGAHMRDARLAASFLLLSSAHASKRETEFRRQARGVGRRLLVCRRSVRMIHCTGASNSHPSDPGFGVVSNVGGSPAAYSISKQNSEQRRCGAL